MFHLSMTLFFAIPLWIVLLILNLAISHATLAGVRWNKRLMKFEPIPGVPSYEMVKKRLAQDSRREEIHNFNEETLRISYYEDPGFVQFYDNDTKIGGICGDIWTSLSEFANFTIVLTRWEAGSLGTTFENGTFSGILEDARLNKTDVIPKLQAYESRSVAVEFTPAFWTSGQRIFAFAKWKRDHGWMFKLFTVEVWCLVIASMMILSLVSIVTQRVLIRHDVQRLPVRSYFHHFFKTFATLCNQGDAIDNTRTPSRILMFTLVTFSWLVLISYSSSLLYSVARETFDAPFNDLETLFERTKIRIVVMKGSLGHLTFASPDSGPIFRRLMEAKRVTVASNLTDLHRKVCLPSSQYALFSGVDAFLGMGTRICRLLPVGITYYESPTASGISRTVKNKKRLDIGIMKLREFGLIDALKKRYIAYRKRDNGIRQTDSLAIDIDHILVILTLFFVGIVASIVVCVAENIFAVLKRRKKVKKVVRRFPTVM